MATACVVAADLVGAAMMVPKTWRDPHSETLSTFALASVSGVLATASVGAFAPALLLYPVYFAAVNGAIALLIHQRRLALSGGSTLATGWTRQAPARPVLAAAATYPPERSAAGAVASGSSTG